MNEEDSGSNRRIDCGKENESNYRNGGGLGIASRGWKHNSSSGNSRLAGVIGHCNIIFRRNKPYYALIPVWSVFTYLTF